MAVTDALLDAIAVTAELTQTQLSKGAARVMAEDLARYPEHQVLEALTRCRRELKGRLTIADVLTRIDDGRPDAEQAWAMMPKDEASSVVWTEEMAEAFGVAYPLKRSGENIQARMAFLEKYRNAVRMARDAGKAVHWTPSLGHDPHGRETVLLEAQRLGRLAADHVAGLLPHRAEPPPAMQALLPDKSPNAPKRTIKEALEEVKRAKANAVTPNPGTPLDQAEAE
jgi:hypothetical protein